jgi:hypothetical protein
MNERIGVPQQKTLEKRASHALDRVSLQKNFAFQVIGQSAITAVASSTIFDENS